MIPKHEQTKIPSIPGLPHSYDDEIQDQEKVVEHVAVLELLGITQGIVAITKADLVDEEWPLFIEEEVEAFTQAHFGWPMVAVSSVTGLGLDELKYGSISSLAPSLILNLIRVFARISAIYFYPFLYSLQEVFLVLRL